MRNQAGACIACCRHLLPVIGLPLTPRVAAIGREDQGGPVKTVWFLLDLSCQTQADGLGDRLRGHLKSLEGLEPTPPEPLVEDDTGDRHHHQAFPQQQQE
jgi:hypothetical protein